MRSFRTYVSRPIAAPPFFSWVVFRLFAANYSRILIFSRSFNIYKTVSVAPIADVFIYIKDYIEIYDFIYVERPIEIILIIIKKKHVVFM